MHFFKMLICCFVLMASIFVMQTQAQADPVPKLQCRTVKATNSSTACCNTTEIATGGGHADYGGKKRGEVQADRPYDLTTWYSHYWRSGNGDTYVVCCKIVMQ